MKKYFLLVVLFVTMVVASHKLDASAAERIIPEGYEEVTQVVRDRRVYVYDSGELMKALFRDDVRSIVIISKVKNNTIVVPAGDFKEYQLIISKYCRCNVVLDFDNTKFDSFDDRSKGKANILDTREAVEKGLVDGGERKAEEMQVVKTVKGKSTVTFVPAPAEKTTITVMVKKEETKQVETKPTVTVKEKEKETYVPTTTPEPTSAPVVEETYVPTTTPEPTSAPVVEETYVPTVEVKEEEISTYVPTTAPEPTSAPVVEETYVPTVEVKEETYVPTTTPEPTSAPVVEESYTPEKQQPSQEAGQLVTGNEFMVSDDGKYYYATGEGVNENIIENATFENSWFNYSKSEGGNLDVGILAWNDAQGVQGTTVSDSSYDAGSLAITNNGDRLTFNQEDLANLEPGIHKIYVWFDEDSANVVTINVSE